MKDTPRSDKDNPNSEDFLAWKRLQLSKAKLSTITEVAAMLAGFAVVATVELQINDDMNDYLLSAFTATTGLLVCTSLMALMISTCILPHIQAVAKMGVNPHESPHERMDWFVDVAWVLANTVSIFLFTLDVILLCWIKFTYFSTTASICATVIMIPVLFAILGFGLVFYRSMIQHQYELHLSSINKLDETLRNVGHHLSQQSINCV